MISTVSTPVNRVLKQQRKSAAPPHTKFQEVRTMKLIPTADNVVLKALEAEETTASGIILSTSNKEKPVMSEVIAVGEGTADVKMAVKAGDKVITAKFSGTEVKLEGVEYTIVKMADILAVVE